MTGAGRSLFRVFGGDRIKGLMKIFQIEDLPIESKMLTDALTEAQRKVEAYFFGKIPLQPHMGRSFPSLLSFTLQASTLLEVPLCASSGSCTDAERLRCFVRA